MRERIAALVLLLLAAALVLTGLSQGQAPLVLTKAARICMECVGLG